MKCAGFQAIPARAREGFERSDLEWITYLTLTKVPYEVAYTDLYSKVNPTSRRNGSHVVVAVAVLSTSLLTFCLFP